MPRAKGIYFASWTFWVGRGLDVKEEFEYLYPTISNGNPPAFGGESKDIFAPKRDNRYIELIILIKSIN